MRVFVYQLFPIIGEDATSRGLTLWLALDELEHAYVLKDWCIELQKQLIESKHVSGAVEAKAL